jgi:protoheme IX farnesyltransferase
VANLESLPIQSPAPAVAPASPSRRASLSVARDLLALTKPRITAIVLATGATGLAMAPGTVARATAWVSLLATALIVASANALNMWWERDVDGLMTRTRRRPLPSGRLSADVALAFGLLLGLAAVPMLFTVNVATGVLGLVALVTYVAIYTPMKRHSWLALLVGAVPGAMPPLMGWTTVTGRLDAGGLLLFAIVFLWQVPHFGAIALFRKADYARAGLQVLSVQHGDKVSRVVMFVFAVALVAATLLAEPLHMAGVAYTVVAALLGAGFVLLTARRGALPLDAWAKRVFGYSIVYQIVLFIAVILDRAHA